MSTTNNMMRELLSTVADGYDSVRPGAGECVREMAEEKYPATESVEQRVARLERDGIIVRNCILCAPFFKNPDAMGPRHNASDGCESGKRNHCSCDTCF